MESAQQTRATIFRYDLERGGSIKIPAGAKLLSVAWMEGGVKLWALVDPEVPKVERRVHLISTGHEVHARWEFAGTVLATSSDVYHVFIEDV